MRAFSAAGNCPAASTDTGSPGRTASCGHSIRPSRTSGSSPSWALATAQAAWSPLRRATAAPGSTPSRSSTASERLASEAPTGTPGAGRAALQATAAVSLSSAVLAIGEVCQRRGPDRAQPCCACHSGQGSRTSMATPPSGLIAESRLAQDTSIRVGPTPVLKCW